MKEAIDWNDLPEDAAERRMSLERRAEPDPERPELPEEIEGELADVEERSAQCYLECEEASYRLWRLANRVNSGVVPRGPRPLNGGGNGS